MQLRGEQSELLQHLELEQPVQPQSVQPVQLQGEQSELLEHLESVVASAATECAANAATG